MGSGSSNTHGTNSNQGQAKSAAVEKSAPIPAPAPVPSGLLSTPIVVTTQTSESAPTPTQPHPPTRTPTPTPTHPPPPPTDKQKADALLKTHLRLYEQTQRLRSNPENRTTAVLAEHVKAVSASYWSFDHLPSNIRVSFRPRLYSPVIDSGTIDLVCDTLIDGLEKNAYLATITTATTATTTTTTATTTKGTDNDDQDETDKDQKDQETTTVKVGKDTEDTADGADKEKKADTDKKDGQRQVDEDQADLLLACLRVLYSFTNTSKEVSEHLVQHKGFIPCLLNKMDTWYQPHLKENTLTIEERYIDMSLQTMYMVTRLLPPGALGGFFEVLSKFLSSKNDANRLRCIAALANIATEEQAKTIAAGSDIVRFLVKELRVTITSEKRSSTSWTLYGLLRVVKNLARKDANKQLLVKEGVLPLLAAALKPEYQATHLNEARLHSLESLEWLSYDAENQKEMLNNEELMDLVVDIYKKGPEQDEYSRYPEAEGFLFQMRETLRGNNKYKDIADKFPLEKTKDPVSTTSGHVMMSYQTQYRPAVKETCDFLKKEGFTMWMDIYDMAEGKESTLQTMAEAVEGSKVVIVCYSDTYKNSVFCRREAEYADLCNKTIIPLKLEKGYKPDGWLGFLLGAQFFYDFTKEGEELQDKRQKLLEAVRKAFAQEGDTAGGKQHQAHSTSESSAAAVAPRSTMTFKDKVKAWTKQDMDAWRNKFNLKGEKVEALSAADVIYLFTAKSEAPEYFYSMLSQKLDLTSISENAAFCQALEELPDMALDVSQ